MRISADVGLFTQQVQGLAVPDFRLSERVALKFTVSRVTAGNEQVQRPHEGSDLVVHRVILRHGIRIYGFKWGVVPTGVLLEWAHVPVTVDMLTANNITRWAPYIAQPLISQRELLFLQEALRRHHWGVVEQLPEIQGIGA